MENHAKSETIQLQEQLAESKVLRDQLEATYRNDFAALTKFIGRLSNALRGIDGELDHRLSKMQGSMLQSTSIESAIPVMDDISLLLKQHGVRLQKELQDTHTRLLSAAKRLQQMNNLPRETRAELRDLLAQVEGPAFSVLHYLPYLNQLLELYQRSLTLRAQVSQPMIKNVGDEPRALIDQPHANLKEELVNLLSFIDLSGSAAVGLQNVRQQLLGNLSEEQFVISCVQVVRLIVQGINEERQSAQTFLKNLNDVLSTISSCVSRTLESSESTQRAHHKLDNQIDAGIQSLSSSTKTATSLTDLTTKISTHVAVIVSSLNMKKELVESSHKELTSELASAHSRITELEQEAETYKDKLTEQKFKSLQDSLTRLPNRAAFEERLELEFNRWQRYGTPLAIAIADIDLFKNVNDSYGHIAGDKTLQVIASMLKKSLRGTDFVARYGGEEFVMVFPQTEISAIVEPLDKARKRIQNIPFKFKNNDISITISIGAASFSDGDSISSVFERADKALYSAKKDGRNKVVIDSR